MTLIPHDESKDTLKEYEELWSKIKDLIRLITNYSDDYNERYIKIKFGSHDYLPLKEILEFHNIIIVIRSGFHEGNEYYPQVFAG